MADRTDTVESLCTWLDASPTPVHVVSTASRRLEAAGLRRQIDFSHGLETAGYHGVDGVIVAWKLGQHGAPLRVLGAHTDSPNLRVQPHPDLSRAGWSQLGVEIYGGVLLNSWLDRDLGLAGRVVDTEGNEVLFMEASPIARLPQLAIHLDREISERGLLLDRFAHTSPVWGTSAPGFIDWLGQVTGVAAIAAFDAQFFDITPATVLGVDGSMLASGRLDNQLSCWAAIEALSRSDSAMHQIVILNDHEEVGSASSTGAAGPLLENFVGVLREQEGLGTAAHLDRLAQSWCLSADNAHAVHPNYTERHDPRHSPMPNQGVALKVNANQRYATSVRGLAHIRNIAAAAGVDTQTFVSRNNMPCGSTIGPITATRLGIEAIDVGVPQLSMHSAREMCGLHDALALPALMSAFLSR
jgi:aspartyl aminopeptidase